MPQVTIPALSADGWVTNPVTQADYMFSHYFLSDKSQVEPVGGAVARSFQALLAENSGDIARTTSRLTEDLRSYLLDVFPAAEVEVRESEGSKKDPYNSKVALDIYVGFTDSTGKEHNLNRLVNTENMKVTEIVKISNG